MEVPSSDELVVAEALLLLCFTPSSPSIPRSKRDSSPRFKLSGLDSKSVVISKRNSKLSDLDSKSVLISKRNSKSSASSSSAVTWDDDCKSVEAQSQPFQMRLQVVRKKRSLSLCISEGRKSHSAPPAKEISATTASASSCLSNDSSSSTISSAGSCVTTRLGRRKPETEVLKQKKKPQGPNHIQRRAEAIMNILSYGSASEVRIRQMLGDSPDTSKALRLLLKWDQVTRSGAGGQKDPYIYKRA